MDMKPTEELRLDFSRWAFCESESELQKLIEPYIAKTCAIAVQNTLTEIPPDLVFDGRNVEGGLTVSLSIYGLSEQVVWKASLDEVVLEEMSHSHWDNDERRGIAAALRALADRVEAKNVKA